MERLQLLKKVMTLKDVKRTGWIYKEVPKPESVADHIFGVAMLALTVNLPNGINRDKLIKMALIHDVGECIIGDQVWESGKFSNSQKHKVKNGQERTAITELFSQIDSHEGKELAQEYLEMQSEEAKFLKQLDKLEMVMQALVYEAKVDPEKLNEFWENAEKYIENEDLMKYFQALQQERSTHKTQPLQ